MKASTGRKRSRGLPGPRSTRVSQLVQRLIQQATAQDDGAALVEDLCNGLVAAGLPLCRVSVATPAINPTFRALDYHWGRGEGAALASVEHGADTEARFQAGPIYALLSEGLTFARWRLDVTEGRPTFPILEELRAEGGTDYVLHLVPFAPGTALRGVAVALATDRAGGFRDEDLARFAEVLPALALAVCKLSLSRTLHEALATYLGPATGARVLNGQTRRGQGETVPAAILLADLRAFTALTDREDPVRVVNWLDEHFDALGVPVAEHGGEILKFLGDGFLAVFPVADPRAHPCETCERALSAAHSALARNAELNRRRRLAGEPALEADLVLHFGDVIYGNVGTDRRLDFTVIGRAVNEASRMEKMCGELGRSLLLSDTFAGRCAASPLVALGTFALRGLDAPRALWTTP